MTSYEEPYIHVMSKHECMPHTDIINAMLQQ